jgi:hypothetical protein
LHTGKVSIRYLIDFNAYQDGHLIAHSLVKECISHHAVSQPDESFLPPWNGLFQPRVQSTQLNSAKTYQTGGSRNMQKLICITALALTAFAVPAVLRASDITYNVNQQVGIGSVTGSITTDGNTGILTSSDIVAWNLELDDGAGNTFDLTGSNSGEKIFGLDLTATATQLLFDYSDATGGAFALQSPAIGTNGPALCWGTYGYCMGTPAGVLLWEMEDASDLTYTEVSGIEVIGNASEVAATPEPSSFLLLGTGLAGFAGALRRKLAR